VSCESSCTCCNMVISSVEIARLLVNTSLTLDVRSCSGALFGTSSFPVCVSLVFLVILFKMDCSGTVFLLNKVGLFRVCVTPSVVGLC
jgi:hypothetical protein